MAKSPTSIDIHVGSRIRLRRVMLGLSQEKLSDGLGITFQQVQKYEKGTNRVGASRLQRLSELLDVHISYFFEGVPDAGNDKTLAVTNALSQFMNSKECISLAKAYSAIEDVRVRRRVLELVQSLGSNTEKTPKDHRDLRNPSELTDMVFRLATLGRCNLEDESGNVLNVSNQALLICAYLFDIGRPVARTRCRQTSMARQRRGGPDKSAFDVATLCVRDDECRCPFDHC